MPRDAARVWSRLDPLTGLPCVAIAPAVVEMMHRADPGWFLCCWAGMLYFCASHLAPYNLKRNAAQGLKWRVACPTEYISTVYMGVYEKWFRTSPIASSIHEDFTLLEEGEVRPHPVVARAFSEARKALQRRTALPKIKTLIICLLTQSTPGGLKWNDSWCAVYLDPVQDVRTTWAAALPGPQLEVSPQSQMVRSKRYEDEHLRAAAEDQSEGSIWERHEREVVKAIKDNTHSYNTFVTERVRMSARLTMSMIQPESADTKSPAGHDRRCRHARTEIDDSFPTSSFCGEFNDADAPRRYKEAQELLHIELHSRMQRC